MEGDKNKKQDRKMKQLAAASKPVQEQRNNEAAMIQVMQQMFQKNPQQDPLVVAKQVLDVVDKADLPIYLVHAILHGNDEIAQYLLQKEAAKTPPPAVLQSKWFSIFPGHNEEIVKSYRKTPYLILAAQYGRTQIFRRLVRQTQNVNDSGFAGIFKTNLIITNVIGAAVFNNQTEIVKFLFDEYDGSDIGIEFKAQEEKANQNLSSFKQHLTGCTPLLLALHKNCDTKIVECLIEAEANVLAKDLNDNTALHIAVYNNNVEHVQLLLNKNVPVIERNNKGETAESIARQKNLTSIIQLFSSQGDISQQMAEQLLLQEEINEKKKMKKKKKKPENKKVEEVVEETYPKKTNIITEPPRKQTHSSEASSENKDQVQPQDKQDQQENQDLSSQQSQQAQQSQYTQVAQQSEEQAQQTNSQSSQPQKQQEEPAKQQQNQNEKPQQIQVQKEQESNLLEQQEEDKSEIEDKNTQVIGINPQSLKQKKNKKEKNKEANQNKQQTGTKQEVQKQNSEQQQILKQEQAKSQQKGQQNASSYQEKQNVQTQKQTKQKEQANSEALLVQRLEAEVQDLQKRIQNMTKRMVTLEKDLTNEKKKRQECENLLQNKLETNSRDQDKTELLEMCNEQLKAKAMEISKLKKMLNGK